MRWPVFDRSASRPAQPLDRAERNALDAIAREIARDDASLAAELTRMPVSARARAGVEVAHTPARRGWLEAVLVVLGMVVLLGVVVGAATLWGAVGIVAVAVGLVVAVVVLALKGDPRPRR